MTDDEVRELVRSTIREEMQRAGRVVYLPAPALVMRDYLEAATARLMKRLEDLGADEREAFRLLMAKGRLSINKLALTISGNDSGGTRDRWAKALNALKSRGLVDATSNGYGVVARELVISALQHQDATDDDIEEVYQAVLARLVAS